MIDFKVGQKVWCVLDKRVKEAYLYSIELPIPDVLTSLNLQPAKLVLDLMLETSEMMYLNPTLQLGNLIDVKTISMLVGKNLLNFDLDDLNSLFTITAKVVVSAPDGGVIIRRCLATRIFETEEDAYAYLKGTGIYCLICSTELQNDEDFLPYFICEKCQKIIKNTFGSILEFIRGRNGVDAHSLIIEATKKIDVVSFPDIDDPNYEDKYREYQEYLEKTQEARQKVALGEWSLSFLTNQEVEINTSTNLPEPKIVTEQYSRIFPLYTKVDYRKRETKRRNLQISVLKSYLNYLNGQFDPSSVILRQGPLNLNSDSYKVNISFSGDPFLRVKNLNELNEIESYNIALDLTLLKAEELVKIDNIKLSLLRGSKIDKLPLTNWSSLMVTSNNTLEYKLLKDKLKIGDNYIIAEINTKPNRYDIKQPVETYYSMYKVNIEFDTSDIVETFNSNNIIEQNKNELIFIPNLNDIYTEKVKLKKYVNIYNFDILNQQNQSVITIIESKNINNEIEFKYKFNRNLLNNTVNSCLVYYKFGEYNYIKKLNITSKEINCFLDKINLESYSKVLYADNNLRKMYMEIEADDTIYLKGFNIVIYEKPQISKEELQVDEDITAESLRNYEDDTVELSTKVSIFVKKEMIIPLGMKQFIEVDFNLFTNLFKKDSANYYINVEAYYMINSQEIALNKKLPSSNRDSNLDYIDDGEFFLVKSSNILEKTIKNVQTMEADTVVTLLLEKQSVFDRIKKIMASIDPKLLSPDVSEKDFFKASSKFVIELFDKLDYLIENSSVPGIRKVIRNKFKEESLGNLYIVIDFEWVNQQKPNGSFNYFSTIFNNGLLHRKINQSISNWNNKIVIDSMTHETSLEEDTQYINMDITIKGVSLCEVPFALGEDLWCIIPVTEGEYDFVHLIYKCFLNAITFEDPLTDAKWKNIEFELLKSGVKGRVYRTIIPSPVSSVPAVIPPMEILKTEYLPGNKLFRTWMEARLAALWALCPLCFKIKPVRKDDLTAQKLMLLATSMLEDIQEDHNSVYNSIEDITNMEKRDLQLRKESTRIAEYYRHVTDKPEEYKKLYSSENNYDESLYGETLRREETNDAIKRDSTSSMRDNEYEKNKEIHENAKDELGMPKYNKKEKEVPKTNRIEEEKKAQKDKLDELNNSLANKTSYAVFEKTGVMSHSKKLKENLEKRREKMNDKMDAMKEKLNIKIFDEKPLLGEIATYFVICVSCQKKIARFFKDLIKWLKELLGLDMDYNIIKDIYIDVVFHKDTSQFDKFEFNFPRGGEKERQRVIGKIQEEINKLESKIS